MQENGKPSQASNQMYKGESPGRQFIGSVLLCRFAHQWSRSNLICWDLYQPRVFGMNAKLTIGCSDRHYFKMRLALGLSYMISQISLLKMNTIQPVVLRKTNKGISSTQLLPAHWAWLISFHPFLPLPTVSYPLPFFILTPSLIPSAPMILKCTLN